MAHPDRFEYVRAMQALLGIDVPVSWDDEGPASGNADRVWRNARNAWQMHDPTAEWHVLLQDDALVCDYFLAGMREALYRAEQGGAAVVSGYLGQGRYVSRRWGSLVDMAQARRASFVRTTKLMWGVCIALPIRLIPDMIAYADTRAGVPDDMRVAGWAERRKHEVWYTWPSLADHLPLASLTKHRATERKAWRHHRGSAMDLDWDGPVVTDPALIRARPQRSGPSARTRQAARAGATRQ